MIYFVFRFVVNKINFRKQLEIEQIEREKTEEANQAKLRFFTNISHEFFTPITVINCAIDGLLQRQPSEFKALGDMKANTARLSRLLEQVVDFRKIETGNLKLKLSKIEIVSFVRSLCELHFAPLCEEKNITFAFDSSADNIIGYVDADKLDKIIFNLLSNAFKYNKTGGRVSVYVEETECVDGRHVCVTVSDTGYGMTEEVKANVFKRFYDANRRDSSIRSSGIGLSLVHDFVELINGRISLDSEPGVGTSFKVEFPVDLDAFRDYDLFDEDKLVKNRMPQETSEHRSEEIAEDKIKLLLVEDNRDLLASMSEYLKMEFQVSTATDGRQAMEQLAVQMPDVVVTDVIMPVMNGLELTAAIKSNVVYSHIPVIMLSARRDTEHKVEGYDMGADVYVTKPFEMSVLVASVKSLVRNRRALAGAFAKTEKTTMNLAKYVNNKRDHDFLEAVVNMINEHVFDKEFAVGSIYGTFGMSQSTFYRKLQALIGMSPNDLVRRIKMQKACELLKYNGLNVSEVAYELGFSDPKYFSSVFKKEFGMSPSQWIRKNVE